MKNNLFAMLLGMLSEFIEFIYPLFEFAFNLFKFICWLLWVTLPVSFIAMAIAFLRIGGLI